ncbi:MAG: tungstate ABC transporter substrate-binding protein WtpA [Victivallales bacterium]|nr:tungstate ABC transporter substrate-binding protein WtpA [Victivallales bacterium]
MKPTKLLLCLTLLLIAVSGCTNKQSKTSENKIIVFHAGSLSVPLLKLKQAYKKVNSDTDIILEAGGSRACARKITDLNKKCDLMVSADYKVIYNLLIPKYAQWNIKFATNELSVVYNKKSRYSEKINTENWYKILKKQDVTCGASNPNHDPCGYRTILLLKLSSIFYKDPELYSAISSKKKMIIRPKETDLISLLNTGVIDYMFIYKSVAVQHKMKYVKLPEQINLGSPEYSDFYKKATIKISGKTPGSFITQTGAPIVYGLTIPENAPDKKAAIKFLNFMLSEKGLNIIKNCGQKPIVPSKSETYSKIPNQLKKFATK